MARMASADIMCVGSKSVKEKFTGIIRYVKSGFPWFTFCYEAVGLYAN